MTDSWLRPKTYSRPEEIADTVIHVIGVIGALLAVPVLVTLAAVWRDDGFFIAAVAIYGASLLVMLSMCVLDFLKPAV